jgi:hypothetical protein
MSEDVAHFRECGADWVLPKPFRLEALEQQWEEHGITGNASDEKSELTGTMIRVEPGFPLI